MEVGCVIINIMRYIILVFLILLKINGYSQNITIKFQNSDGSNIPFVYIFDSTKNYKNVSNQTGMISVPNNDYCLETSHVSYLNSQINIKKSKNDTVIIIQLLRKIYEMEEILITNNFQKQKWKKREIGTFYKSGKSTSSISQNLKSGIAFRLSNLEFNVAVLESIKFKSEINKKVMISDAVVVEIKLYAIDSNSMVEKEPLNKLPIYLNVRDLKRKNEIRLDEKIIIPRNGLFISFEVPFSKNETLPILIFSGTFQNNTCNYFVQNATKLYWPINILLERCNSLHGTGNYFYPFINLKYKYK